MSNNLKKMEKDLRAFAKKSKNVKYTKGLLLSFLLMGMLSFSDTLTSPQVKNTESAINQTKKDLNASIGDMRNTFRRTKKENSRLLRNANLELIQLMEQGDQVIKMPWNTWQWGTGYTYNNWRGTYKGKNDKNRENENRMFQRATGAARYFQNSLNNKYNLTELDLENTAEPTVEITVSAGIVPKDVNKQAPNLNLPPINSPALPALNVNLPSPAPLNPSPVNVTISPVDLPAPIANPFTDFGFTINRNIAYGRTNDGPLTTEWAPRKLSMIYGGYRPNAVTGELEYTDRQGDDLRGVLPENPRFQSLLYANDKWAPHGFVLKDFTIYAAGNVGGAGKTENNRDGQVAIHTVWNGTIDNVKGYLGGRAAFISIETWQAGKLRLNNVSVDIRGNENTVFLIFPSSYEAINRVDSDYWGRRQRGALLGKVDADLKTRKNMVYSFVGAQGTFNIDSQGTYRLEGAENVVLSGLGYAANYANLLKSKTGVGVIEPDNTRENGMTPSFKLNVAPESYGDKNMIMFFGNDTANAPNRYIWENNGGHNFWDKSVIGIYQGEIRAKGIIGNKLNIAGGTEQTAEGNLAGGDNKYVENNVGIYSTTGQRPGIKPQEDLGADPSGAWTTQYNFDPIHSLQINDIDIQFGKYSRNGVMLAAGDGTIMDVARTQNSHHTNANSDETGNTTVPIKTTTLKDYLGTATSIKITDDDNANEAATGTIIAYSAGKWNKNKNLTMSSATQAALDGKASEVNIGVDVLLSGRYKHFVYRDPSGNITSEFDSYPIAYAAVDGGKITAEKKTDVKGYKSIVAYAKGDSSVKTVGAVTATEEWADTTNAEVKKSLFENIGAYALTTATGQTAKVEMADNLKINGIAAIAKGENSQVTLSGSNNIINTGPNGALYADKGTINFGGGTITNKNNAAARGLAATENDHINTAPFYAKEGKIIFNGATTIEMHDGILVYGAKNDYTAGTGGSNRYQGMSNITVQLRSSNINLGIFKGLRGSEKVVWTGNSGMATYLAGLQNFHHMNIVTNNNKFKSTLMEGELDVNADVNLNDANDRFNEILMEREKVTINAGKTVTGNGKGLSMGSNSDATSNTESGFINKGTVNVTGGTSSAGVAGINVSYGQIVNEGNVNVDNGAGLNGANGSEIINNGTVTLSGAGAGIAGVSKGTVTYGNKKISITNNGTVTGGDNSIGIFANSNDGAAQGDITVNNTGRVSTGNSGVGIAVKGSNGGIINVSGTGNDDITVGSNGIGVYAERSIINLNTDYGFDTKENGVGVYAGGGTVINGSGTLNYKYSGANNGTGIAILTDTPNTENNAKINLNNSTNTTGGMVGIYTKGGGLFTNKGNITGSGAFSEVGIMSENTDIENRNPITLSGNPASLNNANVGIYTKTDNAVRNLSNISVGNNSIGIYGYGVNNTGSISTGNNGMGVFSQGGNVTLGGNITVGNNQSVGLFSNGTNQTINSTADLNIGDSSYGFVVRGNGTQLDINDANGTTLGTDAVFAYVADNSSNVVNHTNLTATGGKNYGLYTSGTTKNLANIDFGSTQGNVGIYAVSGYAQNGDPTMGIHPTIKVGGSDLISDPSTSYYGIGMAAGYLDRSSGTVENFGTIQVTGDESIGMYASGSGSRAINRGTIELSGKKTVGMYLDNNAVGENYGVIKTVPNPQNTGIVGVVAFNGSVLKNYGQIIINAPDSVGVYYKGGSLEEHPGSSITVSGDNSERTRTTVLTSTRKTVRGLEIYTPGGGNTVGTITRLGNVVTPTAVDTTVNSPDATQVTVGNTVLNIADYDIHTPNLGGGQAEIGMYVDTSGVRFTNPIRGIEHLTGLKRVNLIFGVEATRYSNSKDIEVGQNILAPYNEAILEVSRRSSGGEIKWTPKASSLTWMATPTQNTNYTFARLYLSKIPYTSFAKEQNTYNFMDGLEQRYGVENMQSREWKIFTKLNDLGKGEGHILAQAVDEMKGHQYANTQRRLFATNEILNKEIDKLNRNWSTLSKKANKITTFGAKGEYNSDTAGIIDYTNNAYGVAYIHDNETVKLGEKSGWYAGAVNNRFKFKDIGKSKENQTMVKAGVYKSVPFDHNNSLNWTVSAEGYITRHEMDRKYLVVDEIFNAKANYNSYGVAVKNEVSKSFRTGENFVIRPYSSLKLEYGRIGKIKEKSGEMRLEVKADGYYSIKPEAGIEFNFKKAFGREATFTAGLGLGYETELGKVDSLKNKAKVAGTTADWYDLRRDKEDRRGNFKSDLTIGLDNSKFGVTLNAGYDTKGKNVRGGLGFRLIY